MMNMKRLAKGLSLLLCLGFFAYTGNAAAEEAFVNIKYEGATCYMLEKESDPKSVCTKLVANLCKKQGLSKLEKCKEYLSSHSGTKLYSDAAKSYICKADSDYPLNETVFNICSSSEIQAKSDKALDKAEEGMDSGKSSSSSSKANTSAKSECEANGGTWSYLQGGTCKEKETTTKKQQCEAKGGTWSFLGGGTCKEKETSSGGSGFSLTPVTEAECKNLPDSQWDASTQKCTKKQASSGGSGTSAAPSNNSGNSAESIAEQKCLMTGDCDDWNAIKAKKASANNSGSGTNTEEADRMNDYYQECIGEYGNNAPECDKFKSGSGSTSGNPLNGGSAGNTMGAYENANAKIVECQKLQGEAQEKCMAEYDAMVDTAISKGEIYEAVGNSKYKCPVLTDKNLFDYLACRITGVVRDLRMIVYILACFGMVGFAYSAIIGKINWKQLANIAIGLFILSMTTSIIEYIAYGKDGHGTLLKYGNHLPNGNHAAFSQNMVSEAEFDEKSYDLSGLNALKSNAEGSSWSWKDLKSTINSAKDAIDTAAKTYQTVESTVKTTVTAAKNISNAIKNGGDPLKVAATIASNVGDVTTSFNYAANMAASAASTIGNDIRDAQSSEATRKYLDKLRSDYDALSKKCSKSATACNKSELDALAILKTEMEANTTGMDKWLNNQGQNVLNTIGNVNNIAQKAETATQAAQQGAGKGRNTANKAGLGGTLGDLLSFGYGVSEGVNAGKEGYNDLKENGSFDFRSQKTKDAEAEAAKAITDGAACKKAGGSMVDGYCKCPEGRDMVNNKCQKIKGKKDTSATTKTETEEKKEESKTEEPKAEKTKDESKTPDSSSKGEKKCADGSKPSKAGNCCGALGLASDGYCNCPKGQSKSKGHCCPANTSWNEKAGKCENSEYAVCTLDKTSGKVWNDKTKKCECPANKVFQDGKCKVCPNGMRAKDNKCVCDFGYHSEGGRCVYNCKGDEVWNQEKKSCACPKEGQVYKQKEGKCVCKNGIANNGKCK